MSDPIDDQPETDGAEPEAIDPEAQRVKKIVDEAREGFTLEDWFDGVTPQTASVLVFQDSVSVQAYQALNQEVLALRGQIERFEATPDLAGMDEQIAEAKTQLDELASRADAAKVTMLKGSMQIHFQALPNEIAESISSKGYKEFGLGKVGILPADQLFKMNKWIERMILGSSITRLATAKGDLPIGDQATIADRLAARLDEAQWQRVEDAFRSMARDQKIADLAVEDPGF